MHSTKLSLVLALAAGSLPAQESAVDTAQPVATLSTTEVVIDTPAIPHLTLKGNYRDLPEQGFDLTSLLMGGGGEPVAFEELRQTLRDLELDDSDRILIDFSGGFALQSVHVAELQRELTRLRSTGKELVAYVENASTGMYQLAAQCDRILMADMGGLDFGAPSMAVTYLRDAMELLGVRMDVVRCGDFKGAVEPYLLSEMSDHLRQHYLDMLETMNRATTTSVAARRGLSLAEVRAAQKQRLLTANDALEMGLVDELVEWTGARRALTAVSGGEELTFRTARAEQRRKEVNFFTLVSQIMNPEREEEIEDESLVVLHLEGTIVDGTSDAPGSIVSGPTASRIRRLATDEQVKGVVVRINSPGGSATASEAILVALRELSDEKPVVVSMSDLAASGGYWITCFGRPILAEEQTITGSIGVFGTKPNLGPLMRRIGVNMDLVALDEAASMGSMTESWTEEQKGLIQNSINQVYDRFLTNVARSRDLPLGDVANLAGGRVWSGRQALEAGLIDGIGGLEEAIAMVRSEGRFDGEPEIRHLPRPRSIFDSFTEGLGQAKLAMDLFEEPASRLAIKAMNLDQALRLFLDALENDSPTRIWAMAPSSLEVR
ncbi:MAG: signal peptide peptidase SppA [Planctomycetota bacterium]